MAKILAKQNVELEFHILNDDGERVKSGAIFTGVKTTNDDPADPERCDAIGWDFGDFKDLGVSAGVKITARTAENLPGKTVEVENVNSGEIVARATVLEDKRDASPMNCGEILGAYSGEEGRVKIRPHVVRGKRGWKFHLEPGWVSLTGASNTGTPAMEIDF